MLLFRQLQHITLCAVTQVNDGMEQGLTCSMPFLSTERSSLWDIFQKCRWICRKAANRLPPRPPASAPLRRGKALTSCRCRRLTGSLYRLPQSRRRSLLLRTTEIWMRPRKSWNSLARPSLPLKKPMMGTMPMRVRRSLPRPIPPIRTLTRKSAEPSMRLPKPNGRLSGRQNRRKRRRPCRNRWTAWLP